MRKKLFPFVPPALTLALFLVLEGAYPLADIAAGTITGDRIAAGTITADRLSVSTLSAISANLGTVTAGTVSGVTVSGSTVYGGSGNEVTLNSSGVTITSGNGAVNKLKFSNGAAIGELSNGYLYMYGASLSALQAGSRWVGLGASPVAFSPDSAGVVSLGDAAGDWNELYISPTTTTSAYYPLVLNSNQVMSKTDGSGGVDCSAGGQYVQTLSIEAGIVTGGTCAGPAPSPNADLLARLAALEREVSELRAAVGPR